MLAPPHSGCYGAAVAAVALSRARPLCSSLFRHRPLAFSYRASLCLNLSLGMEHFSTKGSTDKNKGLVEQLKHYEGSPAYVDSPVPIGYNATISAPHMHATCLELLEEHLQPGMHALDVGSGTGYLTACFAIMVGPQGCAVGVEHIPELVASSINSIKRSAASSMLDEGSLSVHAADGRKGWPELAPYDAIHVGAASPDIPRSLLAQLKPGGRMVIPVGNFFQDLKVVDKNDDGSVRVRSEASVRFVPLTSRAAQLHDY
ncbi:hypothetical protein OPV22_011691 [Ensete ventricosum]|uniref:Protein-L-isoaspartate O-methyltransferase n=1 Tax=Ensete ventricosum TaxID=4639 RepID=A0AAV8RFZ1_ENSVE|nr:hypothetical protein OPV22_011691 [Ensete ventricosum]